MKISIKLVSSGIELVKDILTSPCTVELLLKFLRTVVTERFGSMTSLNAYRPQLALFNDVEQPVRKYGDVVVLLTAEDSDGDMLTVKTSLDHVVACLDCFTAVQDEGKYLIETPDDFEDWLRSRFFYLDDDLPVDDISVS